MDWQKDVNFGLAENDEAGITSSARLTTLTTEAAEAVDVPPPKHVYELCISKPCACAGDVPRTGESAIGVSTGLLGLLTETELSAVIAHELGHLRHKDLLHDFVLERGISGLKAPFDHGMHLALFPLNPEIPGSRALQFVLALYLTAAGSCPYLLVLLLTLAEKAFLRGSELDADLAAAHAFGAEPTSASYPNCNTQRTPLYRSTTPCPWTWRFARPPRWGLNRVRRRWSTIYTTVPPAK